MKVPFLFPLVLALAACSSVNLPLSPYRIDVQQGNALEQESVEKLKLGLNRSQVRFLLGTPLLIDPFHGNRWDYVYNFRKAGKLTEERRLALYFEGDVLVRIEAEGLAIKSEQIKPKPAETEKPQEKAAEQPKTSGAEANPVAVAMPLAAPQPIQVRPVAEAEPAAGQAGVAAGQSGPVPAQSVVTPAKVEATPAQVVAAPPPVAPVVKTQPPVAAVSETASVQQTSGKPAPATGSGLSETSIVRPLAADPDQPAKSPGKPVAVTTSSLPPVVLQTEVNVESVKPDVMPEFPEARAAAGTPQEMVVAALNAWAQAWRLRDEEAYLAAYAPSFRPTGMQSREEWEKRRRLLLGVSRNIDLQIDGVAAEVVTEDHAQVSFRQIYRSDSYRDAVIKQLKFVRIDNRWLIEEENVLSAIRVSK